MPTRTRPSKPLPAVEEQLARYRSMRDFHVTPEPSGSTKASAPNALPFCIQKHAATRLHYDFRLAWNGVLKSWACTKGPSYNVKDRRLAVQVEDHPLDYGSFEGTIPKGQYGGGTVMLWDRGTWEPQAEHADVDAGLRDGHLKFILHGEKLRGKWALIRMNGPSMREKKPNWLLIKEHDEFEQPADAKPITEAAPDSVATGHTLEQIASANGAVWDSDAKRKTKPKATARVSPPTTLPKETQPKFLKPQLAIERKTPAEGNGWLHELKLDGYRMQARKDGAKVQMLTRSGLDWTARMQTIAAEVAKLPCGSATLDGEVVVLGEDGNTSFAALQAAFQDGAKHHLTYVCFDLLHLDGRNTRSLPLVERKQLLADLLAEADGETLRFSEHLETSGATIFQKACELHAEGIISKRADSAYSGTRSAAWFKTKCRHEQEFVIGGYTLPAGGNKAGRGIGALLLGFYDAAQNLVYAGRVGTGFSEKTSLDLRRRLDALATDQPAFNTIDTAARRGAKWVEPKLVAQVHFATWTADRQLRQAAFLGLREDKPANEVHAEETAPAAKSPNAVQPPKPRTSSASNAKSEAHAPIRLTHQSKILDPTSQLTKQQLADFYWAVSDAMLPHIAGRPLSLVRVPEGIGHEQFFQKHFTTMLPPGFESVEVPDKKTGKPERYITLNSREAIASLAQVSALEVHPWGSRNTDLDRPDRIIIDLDPDDAVSWQMLAEAAQAVRRAFKKLGLESFLKTTGGKGLHVVIPLQPRLEWPEIKSFCHDFVLKLEAADPQRYVTNMRKSLRTGKIFLDYLRNERGATAVAPWSPRARPGVGVAVPLKWSELALPQRPLFTIHNFPEWSSRLRNDPWKKMPDVVQQISSPAAARPSKPTSSQRRCTSQPRH